MSAYLPLNTVGSEGTDVWYHLITRFATVPSRSDTTLLDRAMSALTCVGLGQIKQDQQMLYHGTQLYNAAIRHMSSLIQRNVPTEELLYATVIFQRLEPLFSPLGVEAWIAHAEGTNAFLRKCYRDAPNNPLVASIYQHQQVLGVADPLESSRSPGKGPQSPTSIRDRPIRGIFDIFTAFKPILIAFKRIDSSSFEACQTILQDCIIHKDKINAWWTTQKLTLGPAPTPYPNYKSTCANMPSTDSVFGPSYDFPSLMSARIHVLYWTSLSLIYPMIYQAKKLAMAHTQRSISIDPHTDQDYMLSWFYADEACRGIPYCLNDTEKIWGAQSVMFPIAQASQIYSNIRWRGKFMWCQAAFTAIEGLGFGLAVCLREAALKHWLLSKTPAGVPGCTFPLCNEIPVRTTRPAGTTGRVVHLTGP
ncbi:hypothetical protein N7532_008848 [Penicillium argentinense]|uniref:Uncharacterized protein n=1 Tax=Penicillium argentinense TaxID=1131581 RepID=A0A9W9K1Z6_9EURO|nr:uncharacterized protein N7532_008848 [Penicillium argentinense]KAJ5090164.1 hypothetical protein N7532_008848 [Penicillium argentinense]